MGCGASLRTQNRMTPEAADQLVDDDNRGVQHLNAPQEDVAKVVPGLGQTRTKVHGSHGVSRLTSLCQTAQNIGAMRPYIFSRTFWSR